MSTPIGVSAVNRILAENYGPSLRAQRDGVKGGIMARHYPELVASMVAELDMQIALCDRILSEPS